MEEFLYSIQMQTEIGMRNGKLLLQRKEERLSGWLELLSGKEEILGEWINSNSCHISGNLKSPQRKIPFQGICNLEPEKLVMQMNIENRTFLVIGKEIRNEHEK